MSTITKERAQEIFLGNGPEPTASEERELARIALASLEAKSRKLFTCSGCGAEGLDEPLESKCHCNEDGAHWVESVVYTAPPAPVSVPDLTALNNLAGEMLNHAMNCERRVAVAYTHCAHRLAEEVRDLRAAMLQGGEPVTTAYKLPDDFDFDRFNDVVWLEAVASNPHMHSLTTSTIAMVALELNKRLEPGNCPVIPDGVCPCCGRKPLKNKTCSVAGCDGKHVARGFCIKHYAIERKKDPSRRESIRAADKRYRARKAAAPQQEAQ